MPPSSGPLRPTRATIVAGRHGGCARDADPRHAPLSRRGLRRWGTPSALPRLLTRRGRLACPRDWPPPALQLLPTIVAHGRAAEGRGRARARAETATPAMRHVPPDFPDGERDGSRALTDYKGLPLRLDRDSDRQAALSRPRLSVPAGAKPTPAFSQPAERGYLARDGRHLPPLDRRRAPCWHARRDGDPRRATRSSRGLRRR